MPINSAYTASDFTAYRMTADNKKYHVFMTFTDKNKENTNYSLFTGESEFYVNASFKDFDGNAVAVADIKNALNLFVYNGETLVEEFAKNSSGSFVTAIDEYKGRYEDFNGKFGELFFNGAGVAKLGDEVGTYTQTETGFDVYLSNNTVYYSVELIADGETPMYIAEQPTVKITYNYMGHGVDKEEEVAKNVKYTVSTETPTAEGFKFWGWFEDEGLTTAAKTTYTPTEDKILYAKWTAAVTLKFDYNGQGTEAVVVADKYVGDNVSGIPAVAADVKFGEKVFAGWFLKHDDGSFGEEASTSTVLEGDTTYYAKWVDAPQSYGTYIGWNLCSTTGGTASLNKTVITIDTIGSYTGIRITKGKLSDADAQVTDGAIALSDRYAYFNKELGLVWFGYYANTDSVGTDTYLGADKSRVSKIEYSGRNDIGGKYIAYLLITYKDNTTKTAFLYKDKIIANVTWDDSVDVKNIKGNDVTLYKDGAIYVKVIGKTVLENDGLAGTYAGDYGEIIVDGYGNVTVGGVAVDYTVIAERTIKFVAANSMKEVIVDLGNGTYAKVLDGYEGTYALPDSSTITLDGFGGAGDGKTYVVNGSNVTIFDGETSTTYGIDVANKQFLGKSKFAGYTFSGKYSDSYNDYGDSTLIIEFDDSSAITGTMTIKGYSTDVCGFTAVLDGSTIKFTLSSSNSTLNGKVFTGTLTGNKIKITDINGISNAAFTAIKGAEVTCADFAG